MENKLKSIFSVKSIYDVIRAFGLIFVLLTFAILCSCSKTIPKVKKETPAKIPMHYKSHSISYSRTALFEPTDFESMDCWRKDNHLEGLETFKKSCKAILARNPDSALSGNTALGGKAKDWYAPCREATSKKFHSSLEARAFFEKWFMPYKVIAGDNIDEGKFTGYYEMVLSGSKKKGGEYKYPIYKKPPNLNSLRGSKSITHKAINDGVLQGKGLEIAWVDNKARLFYMHIQGSGIVKLKEGGQLRLGWAGSNGHRFKSIDREFRKHAGEIYSSTSVMEWLHKHPVVGKKIMEVNPSYVFFKVNGAGGAVGAQNVPLTAYRSIAMDRGIYPYGAPVWVQTALGESKKCKGGSLNKLMIIQDTGAAIKGAIRGDIYFGGGIEAEERVSLMNSPGMVHILVPKTVRMPSHYSAE